ncbi:MAG: leucine-rich repeat domain-containing protein [Muribaculaceae bacterium]|nr:leucine-rich repeat domain-containing protein [Muribaculaceae bacterium]
MTKLLLTAAFAVAAPCASAQFMDVVDGLEYFFFTDEDGNSTACVEKLSDYFISTGVPQYAGDVVIPSSIIYSGVTYTVDEIGYSAFQDCPGLTSITIPPTIKEINSSAFRNDTNLKAVYISDLKAWCEIQFGRSSYTNPLEYAHDLYLDGKLITDLVVPEGVTEIGYMQFYRGSMKSVSLPEGVTAIRHAAFGNCTDLKQISLPSSLEVIEGSVFSGCSSLEYAAIPPKVKTLEESVFYHCSSLTGVELPETLTEIKKWAFIECTSLSDFKLPRDLKVVRGNVFYSCHALPQLSLPNEIDSIYGSAFYNSTGWKTINIPASLKALGDAAFMCGGLNILTSRCTTLPESLHPNTPFYDAHEQSVVAAFPTAALDDYNADSRFSGFMKRNGTTLKPRIDVRAAADIKLEFTLPRLVEESFYWGEAYDGMTIFAPAKTELVCRLPDGLPEGFSITYNGEDITTSLSDNVFELPELTSDSALEISDKAGVECPKADADDCVYYDLQGMKLTAPAPGAVCIERKPDGATRKIRID